MSSETLNRMLCWGFSVIYCTLMGALVVVVMPVLENSRAFILTFILLPLGAAGTCVFAYARFLKPAEGKGSLLIREFHDRRK